MEPQLNISLDKTTEIICEKCNNNIFINAFLLRKASRLLTGTSQDALIPINVMACSKCQHVNEEFLPLQLKSKPTPELPTPPSNNEGAKIISFNR